MAIQLWSKLESASDITSPSLGTGGSVIGSPTYVAAKFNNGMLSDADEKGCTFPTAANNINISKGTIEFWAKMKYTQTDGEYHYFFDFRESGLDAGMWFRFDPAADDFNVLVRSGGSTVINITTAGLTWSVDDLIHFGLTWDREGNDIGDSKTVALYINNVEVLSSTDTWNADTDIASDIRIGLSNPIYYHSDAVIDNLKIYDTCKVDFSDKDVEGPLVSNVNDNVAVAESVVFWTNKLYRSVFDAVVVAESVETDTSFIDVGEYVNVCLVAKINVSETPSVSEDVGSVVPFCPVDVNDNVAVAEAVTAFFRNWVLSVNETPSVADVPTVHVPFYLLGVSDTVTVVEVTSALASIAGISIYEAISVLERTYLEWWAGITKDPTAWSDVEVEDTEYSDVAVEDTEWSDISKDDTEWSDITKDDTVWSDVR